MESVTQLFLPIGACSCYRTISASTIGDTHWDANARIKYLSRCCSLDAQVLSYLAGNDFMVPALRETKYLYRDSCNAI